MRLLRMLLTSGCGILLLCAGLRAVAQNDPAENAQPSPEAIEYFETHVRPLLVEKCHTCHGAKQAKGGLRLDSRAAILKGGDTGPAIIPGKPQQSELIKAIQYDPDGYQMPPTGKLSDEHIAVLTRWVRDGAAWPRHDQPTPDSPDAPGRFDLAARARHWAFQPLAPTSPPDVLMQSWPRNSVDHFILAKLEAENLAPAPPADPATLLRRVTYDLTGLPPTPAELEAFLADHSPTAYEKVVDRLLASPHYGERWGRHWLDLVRFAETSGHEFDYEIPYAWRYRDYVTRAFNADVPYDQFVIEHIAGDLLPQPRREPVTGINESVAGTAFYWLGQGKHSPVDVREEECVNVDNQIDVLSKTFLALSIACARCHDHKFDAISTRDYYALAGYLQSSRRDLAVINPPEPLQQVVDALREQVERHSQSLAARVEAQAQGIPKNPADWLAAATLPDNIESEPAELSGRFKTNLATYLRDLAARDPRDPLHAWALLSRTGSTANFRQLRRELLARVEVSSAPPRPDSTSNHRIFADFQQPSYDGWFVSGAAFARPSRHGDIRGADLATQGHARFVPAGWADSGLVAGRLEGVLRSRTFEIELPFIDYRIVRHAGSNDVNPPLKNGQVHLIVDGFHFIKNPIYGELSIDAKGDGEAHWYRQDVSKWIGHRAYIEIEDLDDGTIAVDTIAFSDSPAPPQTGNAVIGALLADPRVDSPEKLAEAYARLLTRAAQSSLSLEDESSTEALAAIRNWIVESGLFDTHTPGAASSEQSPTHDMTAADLQQHRRTLERIPGLQRVVSMTDGTPEDQPVLIRGNHRKPGDDVPRRFLEVFTDDHSALAESNSSNASSGGSGRLQLAKQIVGTPLASRVIVNRLWHHHFGRGLVSTPDDFGNMGQPPTHPELLDHLAAELLRHNWRLKPLHRLLVLSSAYRMSSRPSPDAQAADPQNRWVHHKPLRRLEGEAIRDAMLQVSGRLDRRLYGPGVLPHLTPFMEGRGRPGTSGPLDGAGRRSLYINVRRNFLTPFFLAFDYPTPHSTMGRRSVSNVPAQALTLLNNPFVLQQAEAWAQATQALPERSTTDRISHLYRAALAREPTRDELSAALAFLGPQESTDNADSELQRWSELCHVLFNTKEFIYLR